MDVNADARFPGSRFPVVIIGEVVWLRYRFNLSLRDIPALVARSGNVVSHETVRQWRETFGPDYAKQVRRRRPRPGDKWHLDEMVIRMNGVQHYLWRAVDQRGTCLGPQGTPPPAARRTRPDPVQPTRYSRHETAHRRRPASSLPARSRTCPRRPASRARSRSGDTEIEGFLELGVTNARTEGYNRVIKQIKRVACGFRNQANYERRIMLHSASLRAA